MFKRNIISIYLSVLMTLIVFSYSQLVMAATLKVDDHSIAFNESIKISVSGLSGDRDWVGIYRKGDSNDWRNVLSWGWVKAHSVTLKGVTATGDFEARLFFHNSYRMVAKSKFSIGGPSSIVSVRPTYQANEKIGVNVSGLSGDRDWVGIYRKGTSNAWRNVISWKWARGSSLSLKGFAATGDFEARLFFHNSYTTESSVLFKVTDASLAASWKSIGAGGGGWLSSMTVVNDTRGTVYASCDVGGVYKSIDHGQTWTIKNKGISMYYVQDIAYDPSKPTTLYAATRGGIFKSSNGGDSWDIKRSGFPTESAYNFSAPVSDIVVDPKNPNIVYAGIGVPRSGYDSNSSYWDGSDIKGAIYKSTDSGEGWTLIQNTGIDPFAMIYSLVIDPNNSAILYAATNKGLYKSNSFGASWVSINTGLPHQLSMTLAIDTKHSNTLYVTMWATPNSPTWQGGVYKSVDGGAHWQEKNTNLPQKMGKEIGFTSNYPQIVIDNNNPQILYLGNTPWTPDPGIYKSINGGASWQWVSRYDTDNGNANVKVGWIKKHGISVKSLAIDPKDSKRLYFGTSTHLIKTDSAGSHWEQAYTNMQGKGYWKGNGLETTVVADIAVDPKNSNYIYAGYWDMGFLKSKDGGKSFTRTYKGMNYNDNTFAIIVDPAVSSTIYVASGWWEENKGAVYKSINSGDRWIPLASGNNKLPDAQVWSIALDKTSPVNSRTIYATSYDNGIYKTTDGGNNWYKKNTGLGVIDVVHNLHNLQLRKVVIDPTNPNIVYAGMEAMQMEEGNTNITVQGGLFKSIDGGEHWNRIDGGLPQINVWDIDIAVAPDNTTTIYTSVLSAYDHSIEDDFLGGVYKSLDGGTTWERVNTGFGDPENLKVSSLVISPNNHRTMYAVTTDSPYHDKSGGRGIFKSANAGLTWTSVSSQSHIKDFESIAIDPSNPSILYAGSSGNGLLKGVDSDIVNISINIK